MWPERIRLGLTCSVDLGNIRSLDARLLIQQSIDYKCGKMSFPPKALNKSR